MNGLDNYPPIKIKRGKSRTMKPVGRVNCPNICFFYRTTPHPREKLERRCEFLDELKRRNKLVYSEKYRLKQLFKDIPEDKKKIAEGLFTQAARLRILLNDMWIDISENGDYELFSQSETQTPYERERPVAKLYNSRDVTYHRVIKQLIDMLPEDKVIDKNDITNGGDLI